MDQLTPEDREERLARLLRSWKVDPSEDPHLVAKVWARLEPGRDVQTPRPTAPRWIDELVAAFAKPLVAFAAVAVFAAAGAGFAYLQNTRSHEAHFERLVREYVLSIDPVKMTADGGGAARGGHAHDHPRS